MVCSAAWWGCVWSPISASRYSDGRFPCLRWSHLSRDGGGSRANHSLRAVNEPSTYRRFAGSTCSRGPSWFSFVYNPSAMANATQRHDGTLSTQWALLCCGSCFSWGRFVASFPLGHARGCYPETGTQFPPPPPPPPWHPSNASEPLMPFQSHSVAAGG